MRCVVCADVNESLPFIQTPLYLVNQLASIWDTFCNIVRSAWLHSCLLRRCNVQADS
eukprot:SAG11_NODE_7663_length_1113_cov_1.415187_1_plen_56_part_10